LAKAAGERYAVASLTPKLAAAQGFNAAERRLAIMSMFGHGVPRNYVLAVNWYRRAATDNHAPAQNNRKRLTATLLTQA